MRERYVALVAAGEIEFDPAQMAVVEQLQAIIDRLRERALVKKGNQLGWIFARKPLPPIKGLYIHGDVGRGKTMLMDLFFERVPAEIAKRRVHFHAFMADVHQRLFERRLAIKEGRARDADALPAVADQLANEAKLLCFDEFSVTNIADAMILGRLFERLFVDGVTVVATSNVAPERLYEGGLSRELFLPFIASLTANMTVVRLAARTDYRLEKLAATDTYQVGANDAALDAVFRHLTGGAPAQPITLTVKGHSFTLPAAARGVVRASFSDLCEKALGAGDYLALAERFHTLVLGGVPVIDGARHNEAKRFITLIDTLYDRGVKLVVGAAAPPGALYPATEGTEAFEFARTASRLIEMRSVDYLARAHAREMALEPVET